jgi:hypothetical protein
MVFEIDAPVNQRVRASNGSSVQIANDGKRHSLRISLILTEVPEERA